MGTHASDPETTPPMSDSEMRLVPITREQRDRLSLHGWRRESDAWDAAPADPAEAVTEAICEMSVWSHERAMCDAVLAALGFVVSSTETSTPDA